MNVVRYTFLLKKQEKILGFKVKKSLQVTKKQAVILGFP